MNFQTIKIAVVCFLLGAALLGAYHFGYTSKKCPVCPPTTAVSINKYKPRNSDGNIDIAINTPPDTTQKPMTRAERRAAIKAIKKRK